mgnify:FL=1
MTSSQRDAYIALLFISAMVAIIYTQQPESEQSDAVIVGIVISFIFIIGLFSQAARKQSDARGGKSLAVWNYEKQAENPDVNTKSWELHRKRLETFGRSKFKGTMFYVGPKGGVYYITYRGTKVYC